MRLHTARWVVPVASAPVVRGAVAVDDAGRIAYVGPAVDAPPGELHDHGDAVLLPGLIAVAAGPSGNASVGARPRDAGVTTLVAPVGHPSDVPAFVAAYRGVATGTAGAGLGALRATIGGLRADLRAHGAADRVRPGVALPPLDQLDGDDALLDACAWAVGESLALTVPAGASAHEVAYLRDGAGPLADARRAAGASVVRRAHSTVHLLAELGVAAVARPLLVGGAWFDESDVALAAHYECPVAYVASSTATGPTPLAALLDAGVRVALAFGDRFVATAAAVTRSPEEALQLLTLGAARALELDAAVGSLEVGKLADLCAFVLSPAAVAVADASGPVHALLAHAPARDAFTAVQGRPAPRDRCPG